MKKFIYIPAVLLLPGCALTEWLVKHEETVTASGEVITTVAGSNGALIGLGLTSVVALAKWWENNRNVKGLIKATQQVKDNSTPAQKDAMVEKYNKYMPEKIKKIVAKLKPSIKKGLNT